MEIIHEPSPLDVPLGLDDTVSEYQLELYSGSDGVSLTSADVDDIS